MTEVPIYLGKTRKYGPGIKRDDDASGYVLVPTSPLLPPSSSQPTYTPAPLVLIRKIIGKNGQRGTRRNGDVAEDGKRRHGTGIGRESTRGIRTSSAAQEVEGKS